MHRILLSILLTTSLFAKDIIAILELESNKFLGFGYRANIGFRMHETRSWYYNEEYRKLHNVWMLGYHVGDSGGPTIPYSNFYASFSLLALTFGS